MNSKGKLFVIEGTDGSGKKTQTALTFRKLENEGYNIMTLDFPRYGSVSSALVKAYLGGEFGKDPDKVDPYMASSFYAVDRYVSYKTEFGDFYNNGGIILLDRYTSANMVHQASKIKDDGLRDEYLAWLTHLEYEVFKIPKPDKVFFLDVKPDIGLSLMQDRINKITGEKTKDIHESNRDHIVSAYENSKYIANKYGWVIIDCVENNRIKSVDAINNILIGEIKKHI